MDAYQVLVIILSVALAVFLVLAIVLTAIFVKVMLTVKRITTKAESVMDDVESVSDFFRKSAAPVAIGKLISNIVSTITERNKKGK
jgi:hypothetical protein